MVFTQRTFYLADRPAPSSWDEYPVDVDADSAWSFIQEPDFDVAARFQPKRDGECHVHGLFWFDVNDLESPEAGPCFQVWSITSRNIGSPQDAPRITGEVVERQRANK